MQVIRNYCICILLALCAFGVLQSEGACDSLLLSVSSANICEDGVCTVKELAQTRTELDEGSSFCFRIDQNQLNSVDKTVNFTVLDSWVSYPLSDCYFTDDPSIALRGICHCPLSSSIDCSNCPLLGISNSSNVCNSGVNSGKDCFGPGGGTHCIMGSFTGGNRYKVCSVNTPHLDVYYKMYDSISYKKATATITDLFTIKTSQVNITFYDIKLTELRITEKIVIDLLNPQYVYLVPEKYINDVNTISVDKLGWFRYNTTLSSQLYSRITTSVVSCQNDDFRFGIGLPSFRDYFGNHPEWQLETQIPGSVVSDPDVDATLNSVPIYDPPLPPLQQGAYFLLPDGTIMPFGLSQDNSDVVKSQVVVVKTNILTNKGLVNGSMPMKCTQYFYTGYYIDGDLRFDYWIQECVNVADETQWGICRNLYSTNLTSSTLATFNDCQTPNFWAVRWPDNLAGTWAPYWDNANELQFGETGSGLVPQFNTTTDRLITKSREVNAKVNVEFLNVTLIFDVTNVEPEIKSYDFNDDELIITAKSTGAEGTCVLMTSDNLCPTKSIKLTDKYKEYKMPFLKRNFKGDVQITLQCYKNTARSQFYVEIKKGDVDVDLDSVKPNDVKILTRDEAISSQVVRGAKNTGNKLWYGLSYLFNTTNNTIANFFIGIILSILSFCALVVVLWVLWKIMKWAFCKLKMRYQAWRNKKPMLPTRNKVGKPKVK